jgi:hypothetical protein
MNKYKELEKQFGKEVANRWYAEMKTKERLEQFEKDFPKDNPVFDKGQTASQRGGVYLSPKDKPSHDTGVYGNKTNSKNSFGRNGWEKNIKKGKE